MLISLTVGKVDAGVAVLLTEDKRLIEFPSILLPPSISSGSIVDITVSRNHAKEAAAHAAFSSLQASIFSTYGQRSPSPPLLRLRNATQTSVVLEWDPLNLATASLRSLSLYRNSVKAGAIPRPLDITCTKISGLAVDTDYTFHLVLRTSAGVYPSAKLAVRTHQMTDLRGITVTPGVLPAPLRASLAAAVARIGARLADTVRIDTTHFVCTEGRGREWERAVDMNIPVVRPEWVDGCEREGRIVGVRGYYLNADPRLRQVGHAAGSALAQAGGSGGGRPESQLGGLKSRTSTRTETDLSPRRADVRSEVTNPGVPPTPPAKDRKPDGASSVPASAAVTPVVERSPEAEEAEVGEEDTQEEGETDEVEGGEEKMDMPRLTPQPRELVQSPFDSKLKDEMRGLGETEAQDTEVEGATMKREMSGMGESFSEVQL